MTLPKKQHVVPPSPLTHGIVGGWRQATFDLEELRNYLDSTSDVRCVIRDDSGEVIGIADVNLMREALVSVWGNSPISKQDSLSHRRQQLQHE